MITNKCTVKCFSNEPLNRVPELAVSAKGMASLKREDSSLVEDRILHDTATLMWSIQCQLSMAFKSWLLFISLWTSMSFELTVLSDLDESNWRKRSQEADQVLSKWAGLCVQARWHLIWLNDFQGKADSWSPFAEPSYCGKIKLAIRSKRLVSEQLCIGRLERGRQSEGGQRDWHRNDFFVLPNSLNWSFTHSIDQTEAVIIRNLLQCHLSIRNTKRVTT